MHATDIVGYTFRADTYCPAHIAKAMTSTPEYNGWGRPACGPQMTTEEDLDEIAAHFQIDHTDESTFDSWEFPKVILADQAGDDSCDLCEGGVTLISGDDWENLRENMLFDY